MSCPACSAALHRMAKAWPEYPALHPSMQQRVDAVLHLLTQLAVAHVSKLQGQGLGIIVWACSKMGCSNRLLLEAFAQEAVRRLTGEACSAPNWTPAQAAPPPWRTSFAASSPVITIADWHALEGALCCLASVMAFGVATRCLTSGALGPSDFHALLAGFPAEQGQGSVRLGAQALSNMLYGFAVLSFNPGPLFFSVVARGVRWQLQDFSPQVSWLFTLLLVKMQARTAACCCLSGLSLPVWRCRSLPAQLQAAARLA